VVVGLTDEDKAATEKYIEETQWKAVVAFESGLPSMKAFGFNGFPSAALIDPKGKIVWAGHPAGLKEKDIEDNLAGVKLGGASGGLKLDAELPKAHAETAKKLAKGDLGQGHAALVQALGGKSLTDADRATLEAVKADVENLLQSETAAAQAAFEEGRLFDADAGWKRIAKHFQGHEAAKTAATKSAELAKDKTLANEVEAGRRIAKAVDFANAENKPKAIAALKELLASPYRDTKEAARAKTMLDELSNTK